MPCISKELLEIPFKFVRYIIAYIKQQVNLLPVAAEGRSALCNGIKNLPSPHASDSAVEGSLIMVLSIGAMPRRGNDRPALSRQRPLEKLRFFVIHAFCVTGKLQTRRINITKSYYYEKTQKNAIIRKK